MKMRFFKTVSTAACALFLGAACMAASGGCRSDLHKATVAAGSIAASLKTAEDVNHANGALETPDEQKAVATYILNAAVANDNFIAVLRQVQAGNGSVTAPTVVNAVAKLTAQIGALNSSGIVRISNPQAQANFKLVVADVQAALATIQSIIGTGTVPVSQLPLTPSTSTGTQSRAGVKFLTASVLSMGAVGLVLNAEEVEELIALAISAASTLVPKLLALRGETDPQILLAANADDASAIKEAEEDGAPAPGKGEDPNAPEAEVEAEKKTEEDENTVGQ